MKQKSRKTHQRGHRQIGTAASALLITLGSVNVYAQPSTSGVVPNTPGNTTPLDPRSPSQSGTSIPPNSRPSAPPATPGVIPPDPRSPGGSGASPIDPRSPSLRPGPPITTPLPGETDAQRSSRVTQEEQDRRKREQDQRDRMLRDQQQRSLEQPRPN